MSRGMSGVSLYGKGGNAMNEEFYLSCMYDIVRNPEPHENIVKLHFFKANYCLHPKHEGQSLVTDARSSMLPPGKTGAFHVFQRPGGESI